MALDPARSVGRTRNVSAGVNASEAHARLVLRATGVPETHRRGGRAVVRTHAHGPVVERQALFVGWARAVTVARVSALAVPSTPVMRAAIAVGQAFAFSRRARQFARVADRESVPARAPDAMIAYGALLGRFAGQPVARITARTVRAAGPSRRTVVVCGALRRDGACAVVAGPLHTGPGVRRTAQLWVARVTVRTCTLCPVKRRPAERIKAARTSHATRVDTTSADARLFICTLTVVGALNRCRRDAS